MREDLLLKVSAERNEEPRVTLTLSDKFAATGWRRPETDAVASGSGSEMEPFSAWETAMKKLLLASVALVGMTPLAMAAPTKMSDTQMDKVVAGQNNNTGNNCSVISCVQLSVDNNQVQVAVPAAAAVSVLSSGATTATQLGNVVQRR